MIVGDRILLILGLEKQYINIKHGGQGEHQKSILRAFC